MAATEYALVGPELDELDVALDDDDVVVVVVVVDELELCCESV